MSFKQLLKKGTLGDLRERPSLERDLPAGESAKTSDQPASGRATRVLYITGDARESRIVSGAFSHTHPHLEFDFSVEFGSAKAHLASGATYDAMVVGWSVPGEEAFSLIGHVRDQAYSISVVAAAEQSLDLYRQAGADECVRKGGSFLSRLPIAIEDALKRKPAPRPPTRSFSPGVAALRVAYAGDLQQLRAALAGQEPPLECVALADTLKDADLHPGTPAPVDIALIEHNDKTAVAIADVRARNVEVPVVLLVEPAEERSAFETFGAGLDEYVPKTPDWPSRLQLRLTAARARYQQTRELAALKIKEARLRSLVDKLPACIVRLSSEGTVLATNIVAQSLLGALGPNDLVRKPFDHIVDPEYREAWRDFVARLCGGESKRSIEVKITTLDGVARMIEATGVPAPSEFGRAPSMLMVVRDVSDRKRLEAAVQQATELAAIEEAGAAEVALEHEVVLPVSEAESEFLSEGAVSVQPQPQEQQTQGQEAQAQQGQSHQPLRQIETDFRRISGAARMTFEELSALLRSAESQHDAALARHADEYARLKAIELEHWRFYEAFVQCAVHGVFRVSFTGQVLEVNPALAASLGYDSSADALQAGESIGSLTDDARWKQAVELWREGGLAEPVDTNWIRRDRRPVTLRLHGRVIDSPRGDGECLEVIAENITAQRVLETQLRRARRWEDVARVTSGIAADLTHVVESVHESNDPETMQRAAAKALALSRQLVAFGRRGARHPAAIDLAHVVSSMEDVLRRLVDEHIELMFHAASAVERVEAAQPVVEEVLVNLTVAASAALPAGGRIDVETASVEVGPDNSGAHDGIGLGSYGVVSLTATGWGIDAEIRQRLLTSEAPADEIARGYVSASRAVRQAAGGLRVEEAAGESLTFTVYLPHVERAEAVERDGARNGQLPGIESATS